MQMTYSVAEKRAWSSFHYGQERAGGNRKHALRPSICTSGTSKHDADLFLNENIQKGSAARLSSCGSAAWGRVFPGSHLQVLQGYRSTDPKASQADNEVRLSMQC